MGPSVQSSHLAIHCDFLTKELDAEKEKRMNLQKRLAEMGDLLQKAV